MNAFLDLLHDSDFVRFMQKILTSGEIGIIDDTQKKKGFKKNASKTQSKKKETKAQGSSQIRELSPKKDEKPPIPLNPFQKFDLTDSEHSVNRQDRNIFVIGETGVGKSTLINGIANYMKFALLEEALRENRPLCVIPMKFNLYHMDGEPDSLTVTMNATTPDSQKNEATAKMGESCTQEPRVYRFFTDTFTFNFADTPGIGDTRGLEVDMANMRMIMKCISRWDKIHGICLLLKPNVSRLGLSLRYCIVELLAHLHQNSIPNIAVVFTNSCGTLFRPGDTMTVLKELFAEVKREHKHEIPLTNENTFCVDNEAVRMLYAHHKGVKFEEAHVENFAKSWAQTVKKMCNLFEYVTDLDPHWVNETKVASIVRAVVYELCSILADMDEEIMLEKKKIDQQTKRLQILNEELAEMKKSGVFHGEYLEEKPIIKPNTVCCGPKCGEAVRDLATDTQKTLHKKVCFEGSSAKDVPVNQIGTPNLRQCSIFDSAGKCGSCGCLWQAHMHIMVTQEKISGNITLKNVKEAENLLARQIQCKSDAISKSQQELDALGIQYQQVQELTKPYFSFLSKNSIVPLNSAFEEYARFSLEQLEKTLEAGGDRCEVEKMEKLIAIHQQQKLLLPHCSTNAGEEITFENYSSKIKKLKEDSIVGEKLNKSTVYQNLFSNPSKKVIEVVPKKNQIASFEK